MSDAQDLLPQQCTNSFATARICCLPWSGNGTIRSRLIRTDSVFIVPSLVAGAASGVVFFVDRGKFKISLPKRRELLAGIVLGLLMFGIILSAYWLFGQHWIDVRDVRDKAQQVGISNPIIYLVGAMY